MQAGQLNHGFLPRSQVGNLFAVAANESLHDQNAQPVLAKVSTKKPLGYQIFSASQFSALQEGMSNDVRAFFDS